MKGIKQYIIIAVFLPIYLFTRVYLKVQFWGLPCLLYIKDLTSAFKNDNVSSCMYANDFAVQVQCKLPRLAEHVLHVTNTVIEDWTAANSLYI